MPSNDAVRIELDHIEEVTCDQCGGTGVTTEPEEAWGRTVQRPCGCICEGVTHIGWMGLDPPPVGPIKRYLWGRTPEWTDRVHSWYAPCDLGDEVECEPCLQCGGRGWWKEISLEINYKGDGVPGATCIEPVACPCDGLDTGGRFVVLSVSVEDDSFRMELREVT